MFTFGLLLMIAGWIMGMISIYKAAHGTMKPISACWLCYGGIFIALLGAVLIGKGGI